MAYNEDSDRLMQMEMKLSYMEATVAELNDIVVNQQREIGIMENHIQKLEKKIEDLLEEGISGDLPNRKPPHY